MGATAGFSNLWSHGGLLPFGIFGVLLTFQMVMFGFQGVELIGVTAGEAENPEVVLPRATNSIIYRILIFYIGALIVIMSLVPWNQLDPRISPLVVASTRIGIPGAADIVNLGWPTWVTGRLYMRAGRTAFPSGCRAVPWRTGSWWVS